MIFVSASSTPSTTARHSGSENPSRSVSCATAPRTAQSVSGLLRNSIFNSKLRRFKGTFSSGLGYGTRGEIVMRQLCRFFCKIESGPEVSAQEPHFAVQIPLQDGLAILVRKLAMNVNRGLPRDCCYIAGHLAAFLEPPNRAVKYDQVRYRGSVVVAIAVHVLEPTLLLKLLNQILVERKLEVRGQLDLVRLNHQNLNRRRFHCLRRDRLSAEFL